jgi:hypothetical protein
VAPLCRVPATLRLAAETARPSLVAVLRSRVGGHPRVQELFPKEEPVRGTAGGGLDATGSVSIGGCEHLRHGSRRFARVPANRPPGRR